MAYNRITWAADVLRDAGLNVVEEPGWRTRGLSTSQRFEPDSIVWHHDASAIGDSPGVPDYMIDNMATHGAQIWVCAGCNGKHVSGTWHLVASGRMAHAGKVLPGKPDNYTSVGIETDQTSGETWEPGLLPSLRKGTAALLRHMKKLATALHFHKTICDPPGRKVDPAGLDLATERKRVQTEIVKLNTPPPPPVTTHTRWAIRTTGVHATPGGKKLRDLAPGDSFRVIDGSGHGNDGWIQTTSGNWVLGEDTTRTIFSTFLWNVKAGRSWASAILPELNDMLTAEKPDTVGLLEAYDAPDLRGLVRGYSYVYQALGFESETPGYVEEHSGCVVLVRDGLEVKAREALEMETSWKGPKIGAMHDPRIIRRVTVEKNGVACRPIYGHGPFGKTAVAEFDAAMVDQLDALGELGPVMALADWNQDYATVTAKVGVPAGAEVDGGGIDLAVYKSCTKIKGKNLGRHGSDHDAKIWIFGV